jgi:hypothetical protein
MSKSIYDTLREEFTRLVAENGLDSEEVIITAAPLTPEEAIGNPEDRDYPLITGRERLLQAEFRGSYGQAFTDMYGDFSGRLSDIAGMEPGDNFHRAVFISSLNALTRYLGMTDKTGHCRDEEPRQCAGELAEYISGKYGNPRITIVGFQPRIIETLSQRFQVRATDMDENNIGTGKFGVTIDSPERTGENLEWCDLAVVTGTTIVNNTIERFLTPKPVIFYGVTISGAAKLLGLTQFCHCGH